MARFYAHREGFTGNDFASVGNGIKAQSGHQYQGVSTFSRLRSVLRARERSGSGLFAEGFGFGTSLSFLPASTRELAAAFQSRRKAASRVSTRAASTARMSGSTPIFPSS